MKLLYTYIYVLSDCVLFYCREDLNRRLSLIHAMIGGAAAYLSPWDGEQLTEGWYVHVDR